MLNTTEKTFLLTLSLVFIVCASKVNLHLRKKCHLIFQDSILTDVAKKYLQHFSFTRKPIFKQGIDVIKIKSEVFVLVNDSAIMIHS